MPVRKRRNAMILAVPLGLVVSGALVYQSSSAAFTATTTTAQESWTAGTVVLDQNSSTSLPWTAVAGLAPSSTATKCVRVDYTGSLNADISLYVTGFGVTYAADNATDLEDYLLFTVKGIDGDQTSDGIGGCASGATSGAQLLSPVITNVKAKDLNASWNSFASGSKASGVTGTNAGHHYVTYMITYTVDASATNFAQGDNVRLSFQWEAQNTAPV
jgi:hypothetical protein